MLKRLQQCEACKVGLPILMIILFGFWLAYQFVPPPVPDKLTIATGREGGAYHQFALLYQQRMRDEYGIELILVPTAGTPEVLARLKSGEVQLGLIQGGVADEWHKKNLQSIAGLFYEPLWMFYRKGLQIEYLFDLKGRRIGVGEAGSGTSSLATAMLLASGVTADNSFIDQQVTADAATALINGDLDLLFVVSSPRSATVRQLLDRDDISLLGMKRSEAWSRHYPWLSEMQLAEGVYDLLKNTPPVATQMLAVTASLVARKDLHPIAMRAMLRSVLAVHAEVRDPVNKQGLPPIGNLDIPINPNAQRFISEGPGILERYLPFSVAAAVDRMKIMLLPLLTLMIPLLKSILPIYRWRIRFKIYRWYSTLREVDERLDQLVEHSALEQEIETLEQLEQELAHQLSVPLSYMGEFYDLRNHIDLVRRRLMERLGKAKA